MPDPAAWGLLNAELFSRRPDIELRAYGFFNEVCDLSFLERMSNVRQLSVNCLQTVTNIEALGSMPQLDALTVGVYSPNSFDFLKLLPAEQIHTLALEATESKKPEVSALSRFTNLKKLYLEGHQKGIEAIGKLPGIEDLTLRSFSKIDLTILRSLPRLASLDIKLGGTLDLSPISDMSQIKYLELWQIKGLSDIRVISTLTGVQYLFLQTLINVKSLPDLSALTALRRVYLDTMKGLEDISALATAPALEELYFFGIKYASADDHAWLMTLPALKAIGLYYASVADTGRSRELAEAHGIQKYMQKPFQFV
jgi:hypothetical protein